MVPWPRKGAGRRDNSSVLEASPKARVIRLPLTLAQGKALRRRYSGLIPTASAMPLKR